MTNFKRTKSIENLQKRGFTYNSDMSDSDCKIYSYRFPIYSYCTRILLECEVLINDSDCNVSYDIFEANTRKLYNIQYKEFGNVKPLLDILERKIENKFRILGIKRKEEKDGRSKI